MRKKGRKEESEMHAGVVREEKREAGRSRVSETIE